MKKLKGLLLIGSLAMLLPAQTIDLGSNVFFNNEGAINIAADAGIASRYLDSPYVMFVLYMGVDEKVAATIRRDDVILVYQDKEYKMPSIKELRANYNQDNRDQSVYDQLGKETLVLSEMRIYRFQWDYDFFPARNQNIRVTDEGDMRNIIGFKTKVYFKNPGFKKGDALVIKVKDKKDPEIWGAVAVIL